MRHWVGPENRLPSGRYVCHVCVGFSQEFASKAKLANHLQIDHQFSYTMPFNPMEQQEEDDEEEVSASPYDGADPVYSPSWSSDVDMDGEDQEDEDHEAVPDDDGRPTYEANNVVDWMDLDQGPPDWAV